jgi:hypothetical protein
MEEMEIKRPERRVVPATNDPKGVVPPKPMPVGNPLLINRAAPIPTACAQCGTPVRRTPGSVPFTSGPHQGGFLCRDCWILEWEGNPDVAADSPTRKWFAEEAQRIRVRRAGGAEILYNDGHHKAYLTPRGTILIDVARLPFGGPDEYDPDRFKTLMQVFKAVGEKVPGFGGPATEPPPKPAATPTAPPVEKPQPPKP